MRKFIFALVFMIGMASSAKPLDRFPWDWGTECPFPWSEVDGYYKVKSIGETKKMDGTYLHLVSPEPQEQDENPILEVFHLDAEQELLSVGMGVSKTSDKIIKAFTRKVGEKQASAKIYIRSYIQDTANTVSTNAAACKNSAQVITATFCSLKGRKCMETENYILQRLKSKNE